MKSIIASFAVPHHGSVDIERSSALSTCFVVGDYHPDDSKVVHYVGNVRQCWLAARTLVRGYGRKVTLNAECHMVNL
jgi:hypothetical protein